MVQLCKEKIGKRSKQKQICHNQRKKNAATQIFKKAKWRFCSPDH